MLKDIFINGNGGWVGLVSRLGLSVTLSLVFAAFLLWRVDGALTILLAASAEQANQMQLAQTRMGTFAETQLTNQRVLRNLALQTCLNVAKSEMQNDGCLRAAEK